MTNKQDLEICQEIDISSITYTDKRTKSQRKQVELANKLLADMIKYFAYANALKLNDAILNQYLEFFKLNDKSFQRTGIKKLEKLYNSFNESKGVKEWRELEHDKLES